MPENQSKDSDSSLVSIETSAKYVGLVVRP